MPGHRNAWNAPKQAAGVCSGKLPANNPNLQSVDCILQKLHEVSKKVLWQRFWLDLCTKQVVSARACTYHFLPGTGHTT